MRCNCLKCLRARGETVDMGGFKLPVESTRMIVCPTCGNKRCPQASDCSFACTGSNEPGQVGSIYA